MNEQSSKKIFFNKSTLLSLKAELLKKQEEVQEKKQLPQHKLENFKPPTAKAPEKHEKDKSISKKSFKNSLKAVDTEELEACRKAKLALEKKAELYEHLSDKAGSSQLTGRFLVDFDIKKQQEPEKHEPSPEHQNVTDYDDIEDDSEWMEFTDCLGRTRKCLKSDLELYIKRDKELMRAMSKDMKPANSEEGLGESDDLNKTTEKPFLVQKTNDYLQSLRAKWEEKEKELLAKDKDIHYQDLLFDEARMHGVGYYSFSTDETERRKQMEELLKMRKETLLAQQEAEEKRKKRDELIAARVAAARARQRIRAGLPPEDPEENKKDFTACLLEFLTQQKNEADTKAKEEEKKIREEAEKERQRLREAYVREWDIGKEGVDEKVKKFREMTQEEYVEQQRTKRIEEFAPPQTLSSDKSNYSFDSKGRALSSDNTTTQNKTWSDVRPHLMIPLPPDIDDIPESNQRGLYFSTSKKSEIKSPVKYKNFVKVQESTPILNELDNEESVDKEKPEKRSSDSTHAEIEPPPTYDYYGPVSKQPRFQKPFESDISEAFAQGAKSLESKASCKQLPKHYDFTFD